MWEEVFAVAAGEKGAMTSGEAPAISVVIPAYNEEGRIAGQLEALAEQTFAQTFEVVVADNGSTDRTAELVRSWSTRLPRVRVADASRSSGVNVARNVGVQESRAAKIAICDADDRVHPGWLEAMSAGLDTYDAVAGPLEIESVNPPDIVAFRTWRFTSLRPAFGFLPYAVGANCSFTREAYDRVGGFDESFAGGCDEIDFFWRLQLQGLELGFAPGARVDYRFRPTRRETLRQLRSQATQQPHLYRRFRDAGMARARANQVAWRWFWLLAAIPSLPFSPLRRDRWRVTAATSVGRLRGSIRYRALYL